MSGLEDFLEELIVGGAITLVKDTFQSQERKNERKARSLRNKAKRYEREIAKEKAELERIKEVNDLKEQLAKVELQLNISRDEADAISQEYEQQGQLIREINKEIADYSKSKNLLKEKLGKVVKNSDEYNDVLSRIQLLSLTIQNMIKHCDDMEQSREQLLASLRENNHITKELNDKKKLIQQQMQQLNSDTNTLGQKKGIIFGDACQAGKRIWKETDRFWNGPDGKRFMEEAEKTGNSLLEEAEKFWNGPNGKRFMEEAEKTGNSLLEEAEDFWNGSNGKRIMEEAEKMRKSLMRDGEEFWNGLDGKRFMNEDESFCADFDEDLD